MSVRKAFKIFSEYTIKNGIGNPGLKYTDIPFDSIPGYLHLNHALPALLYDIGLMLRGEKPRYVCTRSAIFKQNKVIIMDYYNNNTN